jgi:arylsulfatase A-like enzyme
MAELKNVLLLIFDDLSPLWGCYGDPIAKTPNIDRLAARGVTFRNAHTPCAICSPGRATIFTGLQPDQHGVTQLSHKLRGKMPDLVTWPQALRARGWHTSGVGKVFHKGVPDGVASPGNELTNHGCGDVFSWDTFHSPGSLELNFNGVMRNYTPWETHTAGIGGAISWLRAEKGDLRHHDAKVATHISNQIRHHAIDDDPQPTFWAAGFVRPHVPLVAPKEYFELYDDIEIPLPVEPAEATPRAQPVADQWCSNFNLSDEERRESIRAYYATISFADAQVGRILEAVS